MRSTRAPARLIWIAHHAAYMITGMPPLSIRSLLLAPVALLLLPGCAAMQQSYVDQMCNTEGAYNQGYNDGHSTGRMDSSFSSMCPTDQDTIRRSYRDGFDKGAAQKATEPPSVIVNTPPSYPPTSPGTPYPNGDDGYICHQAFGERHCGYDCKEAYGQVKCAQRRRDNCVAAFGTIKCGLRCREEFGEIQCDRYE
jgi:hypothetical protein